jgi:hypothetical protein
LPDKHARHPVLRTLDIDQAFFSKRAAASVGVFGRSS